MPEANQMSDEERANVLKTFIKEGRIPALPSQHSKRRVLLEWVAERFETGRVYTEVDVNLALKAVHDDTSTLRRELIVAKLLARDAAGREYTRLA